MRHSYIPLPVILLLCSVFTVSAAFTADPPGILSHQGRIVVDSVNFDGNGQFKFALVNSDGTATFWSNDDSSTTGDEPTTAVPVTLDKGHYSVLLGDTPMVAIAPNVFANNPDVRLRIWFSADDGGTFEQLTPDRRIASVGYALNATGPFNGASIADGSIPATALEANVIPSFASSGNNHFFGPQAGNTITTGSGNTGLGLRSLGVIDTGSSNTAVGFNTLRDTGGANSNTAIGTSALQANTSGSSNTAVGARSMLINTTGDKNTVVGTDSLKSNTEGSENTTLGLRALVNATGSNNIAIGAHSGSLLTGGDHNIVIGHPGVIDEAATIRIGGSNQTKTFVAGIRDVTPDLPDASLVSIDSAGQLGTATGLRIEFPNIGDTPNLIGGHESNQIDPGAKGSVIAGGGDVGEFDSNTIEAGGAHSFIGGGIGNTVTGPLAVVCGGHSNSAVGSNSTVAGGYKNEASGFEAIVAGGSKNKATGGIATVCGGYKNAANGLGSTIPGGFNNVTAADASYSFAGGRRARANHPGSFVWGDATDSDIESATDNDFTVRASGGVRFFSKSDLSSGVFLPVKGAAWSSISDRDVKKNFNESTPSGFLSN